VAAEQARAAGHSTDSELQLLTAHGILHLLGYDHGDDEQEREMFELQGRLLGDWTAAAGRPPIRAPRPGTGGEVRDTAGGRSR
jgi:probable rRNA maturation factor